MSNPTCLWCGEATHAQKGNRFCCMKDGCCAKGILVSREMLEQYPVPCELEVWVVEYGFGPEDTTVEPIQATWLGYFATEDLAEKAAREVFGDMREVVGSQFTWETVPVVFVIQGRVAWLGSWVAPGRGSPPPAGSGGRTVNS